MTAFYWQVRERLDPVLKALGFRIATEHYNYESFGSGWAEYSRRGMRVRLDWDGRDETLAVTCQRRALSRIPLGTWVNVEVRQVTRSRSSVTGHRPALMRWSRRPQRFSRGRALLHIAGRAPARIATSHLTIAEADGRFGAS